MRFIQGIVWAILALLNVVSAVPEVHTSFIHQPHLKHKAHFIQDEEFFVSPGQVFGTCYEMSLLPKTIKVKCTFVMQTTELFDSPDHLQVCNFTLKSMTLHDKKNYYTPLKVTALDEDKAFLTMTHIDHRRFYVLHFEDCRAVEVKLGIEHPMITAPGDGVFDVIVTKADKGFCGSKYCKLVVNNEGEIVVDKHDWVHEECDIIAVARSPLMESIVVDKSQKQWKYSNDGLVRIYTVNDDGSINIIKQYQAQAGPGVHYGAITTSTTDNLLTVCSTNKKNLTYAQFDHNGNLLFEGLWKNEKISLIHTLRVYNVPGGGFLLVMTICDKKNNVKQCKKNGDNIFVKRFNKFGRETGTMDITSWKHTDVKRLHFYVTADEKKCLSAANGHDVQYDGTIFLNIICFEDTDFTSIYL